MKIKVEFYKRSGKFYQGGHAEIPDSSEIWHDGIYQLILDNQDCLHKGAGKDFILVVDLEEDEQKRLPKKFFKQIYFNPVNLMK